MDYFDSSGLVTGPASKKEQKAETNNSYMYIKVCTYTHTGAYTHRSMHMYTHISMYMYTHERAHAHRYSQNKQKMNC